MAATSHMKFCFLKSRSEVLLNLDIAMKKKLVLYQPLLREQIKLGVQLAGERSPGFFLKIDKKCTDFGKNYSVYVRLWAEFSFEM